MHTYTHVLMLSSCFEEEIWDEHSSSCQTKPTFASYYRWKYSHWAEILKTQSEMAPELLQPPPCVWKQIILFLWNPIFIILNTRNIPWLFWTRVSPIKSTDIEWVLIRSNSHFILAIIILSLTTQIKVLLTSSNQCQLFQGKL